MTLCRVQELAALNPLQLEEFEPFFEVYDQLHSNPAYLRQIAQLVVEPVLHDRNDPTLLIYCVLRVLRLPEEQVVEALKTMDDRARWALAQAYLQEREGRPLEEVIKISTPGNYPHSLVLAILLIMIFINYMAG